MRTLKTYRIELVSVKRGNFRKFFPLVADFDEMGKLIPMTRSQSLSLNRLKRGEKYAWNEFEATRIA